MSINNKATSSGKCEPRTVLPLSPLRRKYVARQPIFDRDKKVVAYELLFRTGFDNFFDVSCHQDNASSQILFDSFLLFGMNELAGGKKVFINFTRNVLLSDSATAFPKELLVIELLESIEPDPQIIAQCGKLKEKGYHLALDDFVFQPRFKPLMQFMDIVKIDFLDTPPDDCQKIFSRVNSSDIKFLAEKVETNEVFEQAKAMGYTYFQGFFFSKPVIVSSNDISSLEVNMLNLLSKLFQPETNMEEIEQIIKKDVALAFKLIRFINSASFGFSVEVHSIMHALNLLGIAELRKWISLIVLSQLSHDEPDELMVSSIIRARFCELIAQHIRMTQRCAEFFLMGLFSQIDVFFERPMPDILLELPLTTDIKQALLTGNGTMGQVLHFVTAYERGDWTTIFTIATHLELPEEIIPELYFDTIVWSNALKL